MGCLFRITLFRAKPASRGIQGGEGGGGGGAAALDLRSFALVFIGQVAPEDADAANPRAREEASCYKRGCKAPRYWASPAAT